MQTTETMTAAANARTILHCPDWCELDARQHVPEFDDQGRLAVWHMGPGFGFISTSATTRGETLEDQVGELDDVALTAAELRKVASDALAAADWLESLAATP